MFNLKSIRAPRGANSVGPLVAAAALLFAAAQPVAAADSLSFGATAAPRQFVDTILPTHEDFLVGVATDAGPAFQPSLAELVVLSAAPEPVSEYLFERGIASTYGTGDGFQGNRTACGQIFDTFVPQVAHKTLPCGTLVRVENRHTGQSVAVEVTDRGPYIPGRVVDLSWAAFRELGPTAPGLLDVTVYVIEG